MTSRHRRCLIGYFPCQRIPMAGGAKPKAGPKIPGPGSGQWRACGFWKNKMAPPAPDMMESSSQSVVRAKSSTKVLSDPMSHGSKQLEINMRSGLADFLASRGLLCVHTHLQTHTTHNNNFSQKRVRARPHPFTFTLRGSFGTQQNDHSALCS